MKVFWLIVLVFISVSSYAEELQKGKDAYHVENKKLLPDGKKSEFIFTVGIQTVLHDYGVSAGLGDSESLGVGFATTSDLDIDATYKRDTMGVYLKFNTDLEDPTLTLNARDVLNDKSNNNINIGYFHIFDDRYSITYESRIDNSNIKVSPRKTIVFNDKKLLSSNEYKFNISSKEHKLGVSNYGEKKDDSYIEVFSGLKTNKINLPVYDKEKNKITNVKYKGDGLYFSIAQGLKTKSVNMPSKKFEVISSLSGVDFSRGRLYLPSGNISVNKYSIKREVEFYLNKKSSLSYVVGGNSLVKENLLSNLGGAVVTVGASYIAYSVFNNKIPSSIPNLKKNFLQKHTDKNAGDNMILGMVGDAAITFIGSKIVNKLFNHKKKAYLNDTFYGVKFNYEF